MLNGRYQGDAFIQPVFMVPGGSSANRKGLVAVRVRSSPNPISASRTSSSEGWFGHFNFALTSAYNPCCCSIEVTGVFAH
jgi:hypothetical protein